MAIEAHHRRPKVLEVTGFSVSTLYRKMANGEFPKPKKMSENIVAWPDSVLKQWLEERDTKQAA
ncbi:MAG: AlpA family phage regulatory protein [Litoreibacter sp.]